MDFDLAADCILAVAAADTTSVVTLDAIQVVTPVVIQVVERCLLTTDVDAVVAEFAVLFHESSADVADTTRVADAMWHLSKLADQLVVTHVVVAAAEDCSPADYYLDSVAVAADVIRVADAMLLHLVQLLLPVQRPFQAAVAMTRQIADVV